MRKIILLVLTGVLFAGCTPPPPHEHLPLDCGPYPKGYEDIIRGYVTHLVWGPEYLKDFDIYKKPERIKLDTEYPQIPLNRLHWVWETFILYNVKSKDGKYMGKRLHVAWIRYDHLVAFDYEAVDLDYFLKIRADDIRNKVKNK